MSVSVFGIRHHGPGCARSLRGALQELNPDVVLVEGPPEGDALIPLVLEEGMQPPVALLVYRPDLPRRATFYPFAVFSPEWQALCHAAEQAIPVRFCDLPQAIGLAREPEVTREQAGEPDPATEEEGDPTPGIRDDPIGLLTQAAGYAEGELWWEEEIERRRDARGMFEAIGEAMRELRTMAGEESHELERMREAWMRQTVRQVESEGYQRIAVVCGAWHVPALLDRPAVREDSSLLSGLSRVKVSATWIPWTHDRLSYHTGYGAGVRSPGWYHHLWTSPERPSVGWIARAAHLLRAEHLDAPASGVIDGVRLAETLAALRGRRDPGLQELRESIQTVLCAGEWAPMELIRSRLEVGAVMGAVSANAPAVPLQRDVAEQQRRARLKPDDVANRPAGFKLRLDLDLRKETDRARSLLLHRLRALGVAWGTLERSPEAGQPYRRGGTFHEVWTIQWQVEFPLLLIEKNVWGNTLLDAADSYLRHRAEGADLPGLTELLREAAVGELLGAISHLLDRIAAQSVVTADTRLLMDALLPLAQVARYGDVRGTTGDDVLPIVDGLFARALVGLPGACTGLDDEAATRTLDSMMRLQASIDLLDRLYMHDEWSDTLHDLIPSDSVHPMLRGWCCRRLFESRRIDEAELEKRAALALSRGAGANEGAAWTEGLLRGPGVVLLHQDGVWLALDHWLQRLDGETFNETLPLLRRAFSSFEAPERRAMGEKVKRLRVEAADEPALAARDGAAAVVRERAERVIPTLADILGVELPVGRQDVSGARE